jgi:hypothetical protein
MSNEIADKLQSELYSRASYIKDRYPDIVSIKFETIETNYHRENRLDDFTLYPDARAYFILRCPEPKCLGKNSGIDFSHIIDEMYAGRITQKDSHLNCGGYNGYNMVASCDWFIKARISIAYGCK